MVRILSVWCLGVLLLGATSHPNRLQAEPLALDQSLLDTMQSLAWGYLQQGRTLAAQDLFCDSVALAREDAPGSPLLLQSLDGLVRFRRRQGDPEALLASLLELLEFHASKSPGDPVPMAALIADIGGVEHSLQRLPEAAAHLLQAAELYRQFHGPRSAQADRLDRLRLRVLLDSQDREAAARLLEELRRRASSGHLDYGQGPPAEDAELASLGARLEATPAENSSAPPSLASSATQDE